ncbi:WYL domain-containing protein [Agaribacterium sp. ZY112]|uniref:WYL domain-containing protein n=1 Tax=Agaribacterium sp. ZY112 TaxID=3233574 RepID=UPI0035269F8E
MDKISQPKQERLAHIDFRLYFLGNVGRLDLMARFGIAEAAATRDLTDYKKRAEQNLEYDTKAKLYKTTEAFKPLFDYRADQILSALSKGFGGDIVNNPKPYVPCETPSQLNKPDVDVLARLSRAIYNKEALAIQYRSVRSGYTEREIVPFCLVDNGLRWHVRAFDRRREQFMDLVITRISNPAAPQQLTPSEHESKDLDIQWNRIVELEIIAHPNLEHKETIEVDYGMQEGVLNLNIRAAVAGYLLRRWNIDCTKEGTLKGDEYHLWLRNRQALYGVDNLKIAPGIDLQEL